MRLLGGGGGCEIVDRAIDGTFDYLAVEKTAIRLDPLERSTDLPEKIFGARR